METAEVVHEGWLIKSPPPKRFPRAKWRRRYFVLRRSGSLPYQYVLEYFSDASKRKLKGCIELDQCEQVDAAPAPSDAKRRQNDFMFDIRTPKRTFCLVAESRPLLQRWVDCICRVCGLSVSQRHDHDGRVSCAMGSATGLGDGTDAVSDADDSDSPPISPSSPCSISGPYIPISECISGPPLLAHPPVRLPAPARAPVSASPFSAAAAMAARRRPLTRRLTDVTAAVASQLSDQLLRCPDQPPPPPPQVNWDTYPGQPASTVQHSRSSSVPDSLLDVPAAPPSVRPPRPPKPAHLSEQQPCYQNWEELVRSPGRLSDAESGTPRTPTTVPVDDVSGGRATLPAAASGMQQPALVAPRGQIFNYDFSERPPPAPAVNRTLKPRKGSEPLLTGCSSAAGDLHSAPLTPSGSCSQSTAVGGGGTTHGTPTPGSAPPVVNRFRKPPHGRQPGATTPSPSAAGKVFNLAPPPVRHGSGTRPQRAAPSPTPTAVLCATSNTLSSSPRTPTRSQMYCYSEDGDGSSFHEIQYLDLDLADSPGSRAAAVGASAAVEAAAGCSSGVRSSTGTVYKTVDFVKTEAFNKTRQSVAMERIKTESLAVSLSSVDVSRREH